MPVDVPRSPYDPEYLEEFHLGDAPLVRVLAQVRHSALRALSGEEGHDAALRIAARVADDYPIFEPHKETSIVLTSEGVNLNKESSSSIWRLRSADEVWQVSFARQFIALETSRYAGRGDFCRRLARILGVYQAEVKPPGSKRIGLRYTNRISDPLHLANIAKLLRPELLGPAGVSLPDGIRLRHSFSQAQFSAPDGGSLINYGLLPRDRVFDPSIEPVSVDSWLLDIDAFHSARIPFEADKVGALVESLAIRAYTHFRWAVTDEFLTTFRGSR